MKIFDALKNAVKSTGTINPLEIPALTPDELEATLAKRGGREDLLGTVKPFDRYGRRRVFTVHHTAPNRAEHRARRRAGYNVGRYVPNKPLVGIVEGQAMLFGATASQPVPASHWAHR